MLSIGVCKGPHQECQEAIKDTAEKFCEGGGE